MHYPGYLVLCLCGVRLSRQLNSHLSETSWCLLKQHFTYSHWNFTSLSLSQVRHPFIRWIAHARVASRCPPFLQGIFVAEGKAFVQFSQLWQSGASAFHSFLWSISVYSILFFCGIASVLWIESIEMMENTSALQGNGHWRTVLSCWVCQCCSQ